MWYVCWNQWGFCLKLGGVETVQVFSEENRVLILPAKDRAELDIVGMSTLFLPDLQYHFHDMDPNWVVNHAYNIASYIFENDNPIKGGDHIDGIVNGQFDQSVQWKCHYEESLIQPVREVIDICMGEFAAGGREYE